MAPAAHSTRAAGWPRMLVLVAWASAVTGLCLVGAPSQGRASVSGQPTTSATQSLLEVMGGERLDSWVEGATLADTNADGKLDLLFTTSFANNFGGQPDPTQWHLWRDKGTFNRFVFAGDPSSWRTSEINAAPFGAQVTAGDLDGDGDQDAAVVVTGGIDLFRNVGRRFRRVRTLHTYAPSGIEATDVDGDGRDELVVADLSGRVRIWHQRRHRLVRERRRAMYTRYVIRELTVTDFNRDGRLDLVLGTNAGPVIALQRRDHSFTKPQTFPTHRLHNAYWSEGIGVGDLNADGRPDVVVAGGTYPHQFVMAFYQSPDHLLGRPHLIPFDPGDEPWAVEIADLNGDARPDLIVVGNHFNGLHVYLQRRDGSLGASRDFTVPGNGGDISLQSLTTADLTHDGRRDIMYAAQNSGVIVLSSIGPVPEIDTRVLGRTRIHQRLGRPVAVTFAGTNADSRTQCSLDGASFRPCTSPWVHHVRAARRHVLRIRAHLGHRVDPRPARVVFGTAISS